MFCSMDFHYSQPPKDPPPFLSIKKTLEVRPGPRMSPLFSPSSQGRGGGLCCLGRDTIRGTTPLGIASGIRLWFLGFTLCLCFLGRLRVQRPRHEASLLFLGRLRLPKERPNPERNETIASRAKATPLPRKRRLLTGNSF